MFISFQHNFILRLLEAPLGDVQCLPYIAKSPKNKCVHLTTAGSHIEYCTSLCVPADLAVGTLRKYISLQISHTIMIHFCRTRLCAYKSTHPTSTAAFLRTRDCARACFSSAVALKYTIPHSYQVPLVHRLTCVSNIS